MDTLPVYIPHPHICHMAQYECCKRHQDCPLFDKCSSIQKQTVCKRDCPSCSYNGCSLSTEKRQNAPVYVAGVIQENRIELHLETRYFIEQLAHKKGQKHITGSIKQNTVSRPMRKADAGERRTRSVIESHKKPTERHTGTRSTKGRGENDMDFETAMNILHITKCDMLGYARDLSYTPSREEIGRAIEALEDYLAANTNGGD